MAATTACRPNTYLAGTQNGLAAEDMELNRDGHSTDPKADTALQFARKVAKSRGHIEDAGIEAVRCRVHRRADRRSRRRDGVQLQQPTSSTILSRPTSTFFSRPSRPERQSDRQTIGRARTARRPARELETYLFLPNRASRRQARGERVYISGCQVGAAHASLEYPHP